MGITFAGTNYIFYLLMAPEKKKKKKLMGHEVF